MEENVDDNKSPMQRNQFFQESDKLSLEEEKTGSFIIKAEKDQEYIQPLKLIEYKDINDIKVEEEFIKCEIECEQSHSEPTEPQLLELQKTEQTNENTTFLSNCSTELPLQQEVKIEENNEGTKIELGETSVKEKAEDNFNVPYTFVFQTESNQWIIRKNTNLKNSKNVNYFKCSHCAYQTIYRSKFNSHIIIHRDTKEKHKCDQCDYQTGNKSRYNDHLLKHRRPEENKTYKCDQCCFQSIYKRNVTTHLTKHASKEVITFKCNHCNYETESKSQYACHVIKHIRPEKLKLFECLICSKLTPSKASLFKHLRRHKRSERNDILSLETLNRKDHTVRNNKSKVKKFKCNHCNYESEYRSHYVRHTIKHKKPDEIEFFKCFHCEYSTPYKNALIRHFLQHGRSKEMDKPKHKNPKDVKMIKCNHCNYQSAYKSHYVRHTIKHKKPDEIEYFKCLHCEYSTPYKINLNRHLIQHEKQQQINRLKQKFQIYSGIIKKHKTNR